MKIMEMSLSDLICSALHRLHLFTVYATSTSSMNTPHLRVKLDCWSECRRNVNYGKFIIIIFVFLSKNTFSQRETCSPQENRKQPQTSTLMMARLKHFINKAWCTGEELCNLFKFWRTCIEADKKLEIVLSKQEHCFFFLLKLQLSTPTLLKICICFSVKSFGEQNL